MPGGHTVYAAVGDLFAYLCIAALILIGVAAKGRLPQSVHHSRIGGRPAPAAVR
jgi:hypothetical protein